MVTHELQGIHEFSEIVHVIINICKYVLFLGYYLLLKKGLKKPLICLDLSSYSLEKVTNIVEAHISTNSQGHNLIGHLWGPQSIPLPSSS